MGLKQKEVLRRAWMNTINSMQQKRWDNINGLRDALGDIGGIQ